MQECFDKELREAGLLAGKGKDRACEFCECTQATQQPEGEPADFKRSMKIGQNC
jgi:lipoate synthase